MADDENTERGDSLDSPFNDGSHVEKSGRQPSRSGALDIDGQNLSAVFENPLAGVPKEKLMQDVEDFCRQYELTDDIEIFQKGALVAQEPENYENMAELSTEDKRWLTMETDQKWHHPWRLYWLVCMYRVEGDPYWSSANNIQAMCSLAAAVQGMDETVNNGAQAFYLKRFNILSTDKGGRFSQSQVDNLTGLVVGAPYLACAILGCWLTEPLNALLARRGTIFLSCLIAALASVWEGVANSWVNLFLARFVLGLGIGSKSTTVPVYSAECSPAPIRGALVMMWQMWTAFGIMLGNIMGVAFVHVGNDLNWRLMLGSTVVLPLIVCAQVYYCPESPRWLIQRHRIRKAYESFKVIRNSDLQAARDTYYVYVGVELERKANRGKNFFTMFRDLFTVPRNRRATQASWIVMFMQQFW